MCCRRESRKAGSGKEDEDGKGDEMEIGNVMGYVRTVKRNTYVMTRKGLGWRQRGNMLERAAKGRTLGKGG